MDPRQLRKDFIALAQRLQRPGSGSALAFLRGRTAWMQYPDLTPILYPIPWAVVGAVATRLYMPERATLDLDIAVRNEDAPDARRKLAEAGFEYQGELSIGGSSWLSAGGIPVDVLEMSQPWLAQALSEAEINRDSQGLPVISLPYPVLMKFQAGRVQHLADVTRMLGQADYNALNAVRDLFAQSASGGPADLEDLESLVRLGRMEIQPPQPDGEQHDR
jgi:hypothetical protein